jgi:hypothetical protein
MADSEEVNQLTQLLAVFVRRFGGEVTISEREFSMVEDMPVMASKLPTGALRLRLYEMVADVEVDAD